MGQKRLRVVHLITMLELGGAQQNTLYTVSHLNPDLFEGHLITGKGGMLDEDALKMNGVSVHFCEPLVREIHPLKDWKAFRTLKALLSELAPDIVHTHSSKAGVLGRLAASAVNVPVIIHTYHGFGFHRHQNRLAFQLYVYSEQIACRRTNHLIFVGNDNWKWAHELHLDEGCSASLIRSGVEIEPLLHPDPMEKMLAELGIPGAARLVGMIACLKPQKDPVTFVEAADLVTQQMGDVYFILIGDGELRDQVLQRAAGMKEPSRFLHVGWKRNVQQLIGNLNVMVLTSLWEGVPRVIPEALIAGVPVIASDIDGNREILSKGNYGELAEPRNARDFADKIIHALSNYRTVDAKSRKNIQSEFSIQNMVEQQEKLYLSLAGSGQ